ncbi:MAG: antibiotic biosynthesis monooxygenase [Acidiphilium sp.]|nr:antibiotic biosynthesis monooxygenase [Acidiphilium sp.]MDD4934293.1 antibiotic biosynthesis monooxygenase [Acidiphilium sp.]
MLSRTPEPPYYAVIFSSIRTEGDHGYAAMAEAMNRLAAEQPGYLGMESAREAIGITVSYWADLESIRRWKAAAEHMVAQRLGQERWYAAYHVRVAKVERDYRGGMAGDRCGGSVIDANWKPG